MKIAHPVVVVRIVDTEGRSIGRPPHCSRKGSSELSLVCDFVENGSYIKKKPVLTAAGPVFVRITRLRCKLHHGEFEYKESYACYLPDGCTFSPRLLRVGTV